MGNPMSDVLLKQLELARRDLLELSTQNRLLHTQRDQATGVALEIRDELAEEVFRQLVTEGGSMRFEQTGAKPLTRVAASADDPGDSPNATEATPTKKSTKKSAKKSAKKSVDDEPTVDDPPVLDVPKTAAKKTTKKAAVRKEIASEDAASDESPPASKKAAKKTSTKSSKKSSSLPPAAATDHHADAVLHTELAPAELDRRLLGLVTDAQATIEEQGVNILYLAMGFLKWFEPQKPDEPRFAPLLLIPVRLERQNAGTRYSLAYTGDELESNLTLKTRLKMDHGIDLPVAPDVDDLSPSAYFAEVAAAVKDLDGWDVLPNDMVLWFFSFTKLLMYRDLDPATWPADRPLAARPMIRALLQDGFPPLAPICGDEDRIDALMNPAETTHVVDCDSSQALVIEEVLRDRSLIIQGPPGTGKSQTITNLIASAVRRGKTVLFVAEKMAAMEVVKRRLDKVGIGDICLELHSEMANKRAVLQDVDRTLRLGRPKPAPQRTEIISKLTTSRDRLNAHIDLLHQPLAPTGATPYQILTELIELRIAGVQPPEYELTEAASWTAEQIAEWSAVIDDYARSLAENGRIDEHPWRGCRLEGASPLDMERILGAIPKVTAALDGAMESASRIAGSLRAAAPQTLAEVSRLRRTVRAFREMPPLDARAHGDAVWDDHRKAIRGIGEHARTWIEAKSGLSETFTEAAWDADVADVRADLVANGGNWLGSWSSAYREAHSQLQALLKQPAPEAEAECLALLGQLAGTQHALKELLKAGDLGARAFGKYWIGGQTDWAQIAAIEAWDGKTAEASVLPGFRKLIAHAGEVAVLKDADAALGSALQATIEPLSQMFASLKFDLAQTFPGTAIESTDGDGELAPLGPVASISKDDLKARFQAWKQRPEGAQTWQRAATLERRLAELGDGSIARGLNDGSIDRETAQHILRYACYESLLKRAYAERPALARFDSAEFRRTLDEFREFDERRIGLARIETADAHFTNIGKPRGSGMLESINLLRHEMQKTRRHVPLRTLLSKAGPAVQAVKPVFMMSPLSVSRYLEPGRLEFDLLVIDEASQVRPVEALGAAARCTQMVVVGDDQQMPPTQFFGLTVGDIPGEAGDPEMQAGDVESILALCISHNMPQRMLRWHYRSKHHSLIAVSNREFYHDQLYVIPSPERDGPLGLKFTYLPDGRFIDRCNLVEAKAVAAAVMKHAQEHPDWTLGVGAFSVSQRDAVLKEVEALRRANPSCEAFFDPNAPDPFFVKNLENIQGDERDVVFVSVGYGPDENGKVGLNFGPVSSTGGERRLNVLMTRAKRRCEIFSSMRPEDIDLSRATGRGPAVFRTFLQAAQSGSIGKATAKEGAKDRLPEIVATKLKEAGYDVQTRVGISGVYVDVAVVDPTNPSRYVMGVLCDGSSYISARSARDRDRLRESVLRSQGWNLHRVWCLEWFLQPAAQWDKLKAAVDAAVKPASVQPAAASPSGTKSTKPAAARAPILTDVFQVDRVEGGADPLASACDDPPPTLTEVAANVATDVAWKVGQNLMNRAVDALTKPKK